MHGKLPRALPPPPPPPLLLRLALPPPSGRAPIATPAGVASFGLIIGLSLMVYIGLFAKRRGLLFLPSFGLGGSGPASSGGPGGGR